MNRSAPIWIDYLHVFELTHLFENKEPFNGCFYLNGQPYDLDTKRNERETLNLRGGRKKMVGMNPSMINWIRLVLGLNETNHFGF